MEKSIKIAVISGKGGTGKSCISAAFATLYPQNVVLADCDVDAANLFILFEPEITKESIYISGQKAMVDNSLCLKCGICVDYCSFEAITLSEGILKISEILCDGCKLCTRVCPAGAIRMIDSDKSKMYIGNFRNGKMAYGRLAAGEENTGKLVTSVRDKADEIAKEMGTKLIIIDGPPGIGCPVIATLTGVDHAVIVTEPSLSGLSDLKRVLEITLKHHLKTWVIINKYDLNEEMTNEIINYCQTNNIAVAGKIPFSYEMSDALTQLKTISEYAPSSDITFELDRILNMIINDR